MLSKALPFAALLTASGLLTPTCSTRDALAEHREGTSHLTDIPQIGLGTWLSPRDKVSHAVQYALDGGYNHIDAASNYRNEDKVGQGIASSRLKRKDIWVTSKLWNTDHRPVAAHKAIEKTISDLKVEQLDLFLIHWPVAFVPGSERLDPKASLVETWRAMEELVRDNKTRYIGISNFAPADVNAILGVCDICPYAHEFETHPYLQQEEYVVWHLQRGIKVIAYSPLANTNPHYHSGIPLILDDPFWKMMAERKNATVAQTVLAWGRQRGTVVIPKSVHENYIDENLGSLDIVFAEEEMLQVAAQDKKLRMNDPGRAWGVDLFEGLDDPTTRLLLQGEAEL